MGATVDSNGYVLRAFFQGPKRHVFAVCKILGIPTWETKKRVLTLSITPSDKVTPEKLDEASAYWRST
jgi:hypothetical protein